MITILDIFRSEREVLQTTGGSVEGIQMIAYYFDGMEMIAIVSQYCEKNLLIKEKKACFERAQNKVIRVARQDSSYYGWMPMELQEIHWQVMSFYI